MTTDLIARAGGTNYRLRDWSACAYSQVLNDVGAISLSYPASSPHSGILVSDADVVLTLALEGLTAPVGFVLDDDDFQEAVDDEGRVVYTLTGRSTESLLERAIVYPPVLGTLPVETSYSAATPGAIFADQLTKAHARGTITAMTGTYTGSLDSAGVAWAYTFTGSIDPGTDLLALARDFAGRGLIDFRVRVSGPGTYELDLFNAASSGGMGRVTTNRIQRGRGVLSSPRRRTKRDIGTDMLVLGDNGVVTTVGDATARTLYGRREKFQAQSGISSPGTLSALGTLGLALVSHPKQGRTLSLSRAAGLEVFRSILLGDYFPYNPGNGWVTERITSINYAIDGDDARTCELGLSDRFDDLDVANARKLDRITRGGVASSSATPPVTFVTDTLAPAAPASVSLSTAAYLNTSGNTEASLTISWAAVTQNTDGSPIGDLASYEIQDKVGSADWRPLGRVEGTVTVAYDGGFQPGQTLTARVRAIDTSGNASAWRTSSPTTAAADTTPPVTPSTPTVDASQFLGTLRIRWDGLDNVGNPMPGDFARLEVHASTTNGFTPTAATLTDEFTTPTGGVTAISASPSTPTYVKFIAVDRSGNRSTASAQASGTAVQVVNADLVTGIVNARLMGAGAVEQAAIANLAVGTAQMIDATVVNAKIANLAVDDAKIASVSIGKLTVGTLTADLTVSARIMTASSGLRSELNSSGLYHYNYSGVEDFGADSSGVRVAGTVTSALLRTAPYGARVEIDSSSQTRQLHFYSNGVNYTDPYLWGTDSQLIMDGGRSSFGSARTNITIDTGGTGSGITIDAGMGLSAPSASTRTISLFGDVECDNISQLGSRRGVSGGGGGQIQFASVLLIGDANAGNTSIPHVAATTAAIRLGVSSGSKVFVQQMNSVATYRPIAASSFDISSSARTKQKIRRHGHGLATVRKLRAVQFDRTGDPTRFGVIAEDVAAAAPEAAVYHRTVIREDGSEDLQASHHGDPAAELFGVDLMALVSLVISSLHEVDDRLARLEGATA